MFSRRVGGRKIEVGLRRSLPMERIGRLMLFRRGLVVGFELAHESKRLDNCVGCEPRVDSNIPAKGVLEVHS